MPNGDYLQEYREENAQLRRDLSALQQNSGMVVHALDCAGALIDALITWLPEGMPLPDGVRTCKHNLDTAMAALGRLNVPIEPLPVADETDQKVSRLNTALTIAGQNIVTLNDQRAALTGALNEGLLLLEALMGEMRAKGFEPSAPVVVAKARFDQAMRRLLQPGGVIHDLRRNQDQRNPS
jgi:hypothetical protein